MAETNDAREQFSQDAETGASGDVEATPRESGASQTVRQATEARREAASANEEGATSQPSRTASQGVERSARPRPERVNLAQWSAAKQAVHELFDAVNIRRMVLVDDHALAGAVPSIIAAVEELRRVDAGVLARVFKQYDVMLDNDYDVRGSQIEALVRDRPAEVRRILSGLEDQRWSVEQTGRLEPRDQDAKADAAHRLFSHAFKDLIEGRELIVLQPDEWELQQDEIMLQSRGGAGDAPATALPDTVVLFDLNLGVGREEHGRRLALQFLEKYAGFNPLFGVISSTVRAIEERDQWEDPSVSADGLAFVSKLDLDSSPMGFAAELKRVILAPFARHIQSKLKAMLGEAGRYATGEVKNVRITDVVQTVQVSNSDGVPEIDTFRRIHDAFFRDRLRHEAFSDPEFIGLLRRLREIGQIAPEAQLEPKHTTAKYQRREMYDDPLEVNGLHLPVTVGDVFDFDIALDLAVVGDDVGRGTSDDRAEDISQSAKRSLRTDDVQELGDGSSAEKAVPARMTKSYILVTPHCHTLVRGMDGKRRLRAATLARLRDPRRGEGESTLPHLFVLRWFGDSMKSMIVDFSETISVPFEVLDLCAFNVDGRSRLDLGSQAPDGLLAGWHMHFEHVVARLSDVVDELRHRLSRPVAEDEAVRIPPDPHGISPLEMTYTAAGVPIVSYNCVRVGRVNEPYASALLGQLGYYAAHDTFEVDMGGA